MMELATVSCYYYAQVMTYKADLHLRYTDLFAHENEGSSLEARDTKRAARYCGSIYRNQTL